MKLFKVTFIILLSLITLNALGQTHKVIVSISGLTCSQCTRSVEMQLKKLDFLSDIQMDLQNTTATVIIKSHHKTDFRAIAKAVTDAGFSVAGFRVWMSAAQIKYDKGSCLKTKDGNFYIVNPQNVQAKKGYYEFELLNKPFSSTKTALPKSNLPCLTKSSYIIKAH